MNGNANVRSMDFLGWLVVSQIISMCLLTGTANGECDNRIEVMFLASALSEEQTGSVELVASFQIGKLERLPLFDANVLSSSNAGSLDSFAIPNVTPYEIWINATFEDGMGGKSTLELGSENNERVIHVFAGENLNERIQQMGVQSGFGSQPEITEILAGYLNEEGEVVGIADNESLLLLELNSANSGPTFDFQDVVLKLKRDNGLVGGINLRINSEGQFASGYNVPISNGGLTDGEHGMPSFSSVGSNSHLISYTRIELNEPTIIYEAGVVVSHVHDDFEAIGTCRLAIWDDDIQSINSSPQHGNIVDAPLILQDSTPPPFGGVNFTGNTHRYLVFTPQAFELPAGNYYVALISFNIVSFEIAQSLVSQTGGISSDVLYRDHTIDAVPYSSFGPDWGGTLALDIFGLPSQANILFGDVNLDGNVNLLDVSPFVELLSSGTFQAEADINQDGSVNLLDVAPFVALLSGG